MVQDEPGGPSSRGEVINEFLGRTDSDGALLAGSGSQRSASPNPTGQSTMALAHPRLFRPGR